MGDRPKPLALLSLDGGGIRGMSELIILDEIMHRVQRRGNLSSVPLPADYFDMICGTSTGGLIAILLGRLRLSVPAAIDKYRILAKEVFSDKKLPIQDGTFKASKLESSIKVVVESTLGKGRANESMFERESGEVKPCKTFVCAMPAVRVSDEPTLFRTWKADKNPGLDAYIWEAGRATSAAPTLFKRIKIGPPGLEEEFVDGALGCNNPVVSLLTETTQEFDLDREVGCIVSIGTGRPKTSGFKEPNYLQRVLPVDLVRVLAKLATDAESAASRIESKYKNCPGIYHRLNVDSGLEEVSLNEWERLPEVVTHTKSYLRVDDVSRRIDSIVDSLLGNPVKRIPLSQLEDPIPLLPQAPGLFIVPSLRVSHFVERKGPLEDIERHLNLEGERSVPSVFVLQGMGGCGKSQLALEFCHRAKENHSHSAIFWIDATSPASTSQSFSSMAKEMSKSAFDPADNEANLQFVRTKLSSWPQGWLLVFDNFDDPNSFINKSIKDYFPQTGEGSILVTSRHADTRRLGHHLEVNTMSLEEALELLLARSSLEKTEPNLHEGEAIVKRLGFHALAIDQAGAYIYSRNLNLGLYLEHHNARTEKVLREVPDMWDYIKAPKDSPEAKRKLSVFTTWELSFDQISGEPSIRAAKERILTLLAFFDNNQIRQSFFEPYATFPNNWIILPGRSDTWDVHEFQATLKSSELFHYFKVSRSSLMTQIDTETQRACTIEAVLVLDYFLEPHAYEYFSDFTFEVKQLTFSHVDAVVLNTDIFLTLDGFLADLNLLRGAKTLAYFSKLRQEKHEEALEILQKNLALDQTTFGNEHPSTLTSMHNLAVTMDSQGKYDDAESLYRKTLDLEEKLLGKEHPDTLISMHYLATLLVKQERYDKAEPLFQEVIALREKVQGKEHPDTLTSMHNLAALLVKQERYNEAEPLFQEVIAAEEKGRGKEHPDTLASMHHLAAFLVKQERYDEAEPLFQEVIALREKVQ
ncbi:Kinesin light chain, partial [Lachnellula subtilissima]